MRPALDTIHQGDVLAVLRSWPDEFIQTVVTSPPYWGLRNYGVAGQLGLEKTPALFVAKMVEVFREIRRVLKKDGTLWLNLGDSYCSAPPGARDADRWPKQAGRASGRGMDRRTSGVKLKDLVGIPWRVAFALQADGWYLRRDIVWSKPNPMPESVTDRPTTAHEYIFLLSKSPRYFYDAAAITEPVSINTHLRVTQNVAAQIGSARANGGAKSNGNMKAVVRKQLPETQAKLGAYRDRERGRKLGDRANGIKANESFAASVCLPVLRRNARSVWEVVTQGFKEAHFATFPLEIPRRCIMAGSRTGGGDVVLDPFMGAGTTGLVAKRLKRSWLGIELNPQYVEMARRRIDAEPEALLAEGAA